MAKSKSIEQPPVETIKSGKRRIVSLKLVDGRVAQNCYLGNRTIRFEKDVIVDLDEKDFLNKNGISYLDEIVNKLTKQNVKIEKGVPDGKVANIVNVKEV